jgi:hypothetical protein
VDDFIFSSDRTEIVRYFGASPEVALQPDIRIVGPGCFSNCKNLTAVTFPLELARTEEFAFQWCSALQIRHFVI